MRAEMAANEICAPAAWSTGEAPERRREFWVPVTILALLGVSVLLALAGIRLASALPPRVPLPGAVLNRGQVS